VAIFNALHSYSSNTFKTFNAFNINYLKLLFISIGFNAKTHLAFILKRIKQMINKVEKTSFKV
jgi:hypothetical protein